MILKPNKIDFSSRESQYENAIHYKILTHYKKKDVNGNADIFFNSIDHYKIQKNPPSNSLYSDSIKHGLTPTDIIGHLKFFYPNGGRFVQDFMRNGVGLATLNKIIEDVLSHHGKMIYVFSTTEFMENFLNKNHFEHSSKFDFQYYLYL